MRTLRNSLWPRSGRRANLRRWLIASGVTVICFSALFFKASTHAQSHTSKRARQTSADREKKGRTAKLERRRENEPIQEDVERRENWFWSQRMYPFDDLPDDARRKAWDARPIDKGMRAQALIWQPIGPVSTSSAYVSQWGTTSGRVSAIAIAPNNPQLLLIGSPTGGLWRSTDGGVNFVPVADNLTDVSIGSIAFAPSNPQIVYAGSGDAVNRAYFGAGVLKSTDGGQTWVRISDSTLRTFGVVRQVAVDPTNPDTVYAVQYNRIDTNTNQTFASGFFRSTNGGVTWTRTLAGLFRNMAIEPGQPQTLYLAARRVDPANAATPPGIYRSTNGGQNWDSVYAAPFQSTSDIRVAVTPADAQKVYVYEGGRNGGPLQLRVEVSNDGGGTWSNRGTRNDIDPGQFNYNTYIFVSPADANTIYVGSRDTFKSTNGGQSFTNIMGAFAAPSFADYTPELSTTHPDQQTVAFAPNDANTVYFGNDGGLFKSTNGGTTLQSLNGTLSLTQFVGYAVDPTDPSRSYGGTQDNGSQRRQASTSQWREVDGGDGGNFVVDQQTPSTVFSTYIEGSITRLTNFGAARDSEVGNNGIFGEPTNGPRISFYPPFTGNGVDSKLYFGTWRLFISTNRGNSWNAPAGMTDLTNGDPDVLSAIGVARSNINTIYVGSSGGAVQVSTNEGATWTDITAGLPNRSITGITVSRTDPATAFVTVSGFGSGHVFKTTNTGGAWIDISGNLPNIPTNCLLVDPQNANTIYVGTDIGVFISTTGGNTWASFNNGLPPVVVTKLVASGNTIQAGTYGRGGFQLNDVGTLPTVQFNAANFTVNEGAGVATITLTRTGTTTSNSSVAYATSDIAGSQNCNVFNGYASSRCDYLTSIGTVSFAANETSKTVSIPIIDDSYAEGNEFFTITLSNSSGATLGTISTATVTIIDNDSVTGPNPIDQAGFFVTEHYYDFLNRQPDAGGLAFWINELSSCGTNQACIELKRINVSASYFLSTEFQQTGYLVERLYKSAYGDASGASTLGGAHQVVVPVARFGEFLPDTQQIGQGVVAGQTGWETVLENNKQAFIAQFVQRSRFTTALPTTMTPAEFVDQLNTNAGSVLSSTDRATAIALFGGATDTSNATARAQALRQVAENSTLVTNEFNRAFVLMQFFGYLRRDPNTGPDTDYTGYDFWLAKLNQFNGNFVNAEMVKAFITSVEYRTRFGP